MLLLLISVYPCVADSNIKEQATFGISEAKVIMDNNRSAYNIKNTDAKKSWLVQSWVEEYSEQKTAKIIATPAIFRVNPNSSYRVNLTKKDELPDDRESVFWVVAHSVPEHGGDLPENRINIAYRFKSLLIFRPGKIKSMKFNSSEILWKNVNGSEVEVLNKTPFAVTVTNVNINGDNINFGDSLIMPFSERKIRYKSRSGDKVSFSFKNDYGAINVANSEIR